MTKSLNNLYYVVCAIAALLSSLPPEVLNIIPPPAKPYIIGASVAAMWLKSHWNLIAMPPGTDPDAEALKKSAGQQ